MRTEPPRPNERSAGPRTWRVFVVLAAFSTIAYIVFSLLHDPRDATERPGPYAIECSAPKGDVARYGEFRARGAKPAGGSFRFEVFDARAPVGTAPMLVGDQRGETVWTPKQEELLVLPERIRWRVSAVDAQGVVVDSKECEARRSP